MVRGAYMVEERNLASKYGYEDPINPTIEDTHKSYNGNLEFLLANWIPGSYVLVASHNQQSVELAKELIQKYDISSKKGKSSVIWGIICLGIVSFAQLLGLGDHLTFSTANQVTILNGNEVKFFKAHSVAKLVVFGPIPILIPFFVRRAQETKQMFSSTNLQRRLVFDEIKKRIMIRKNMKDL